MRLCFTVEIKTMFRLRSVWGACSSDDSGQGKGYVDEGPSELVVTKSLC